MQMIFKYELRLWHSHCRVFACDHLQLFSFDALHPELSAAVTTDMEIQHHLTNSLSAKQTVAHISLLLYF